MLTDLEIATSAEILEINEIAKKINISSDELECFGKYKAKLNLKNDINKNGKVISSEIFKGIKCHKCLYSKTHGINMIRHQPFFYFFSLKETVFEQSLKLNDFAQTPSVLSHDSFPHWDEKLYIPEEATQ